MAEMKQRDALQLHSVPNIETTLTTAYLLWLNRISNNPDTENRDCTVLHYEVEIQFHASLTLAPCGCHRSALDPSHKGNSWVGWGGQMPPIFFFTYKLEGRIKNWGEDGGKWLCILRTGSNQSFPLFLTWLLPEIKLLIPVLDFALPLCY
jgi:hypothetical protein